MKFYFAALISCLSLVGLAQPTLHHPHDFSVGDRAVYITVSPGTLNPGKSGEDVTWNFTGLNSRGDTMTQEFVDLQSDGDDQFPDADIIERTSDGYRFYRKHTQKGTLLLGLVTNEGMKIEYTEPARAMERPYRYGDSFKEKSKRKYDTHGHQYSGTGTTQTTIDAWGTLKLPGNIYSKVLRVHTTRSFSDTSMQGQVMRFNTDSFEWYNAGHRAPLLQMEVRKITSKYYNNTWKTKQYLLSEDVNKSKTSH